MAAARGIQRVPHFDNGGEGLEPWEAIDPDSIASGTPVQRGWFADDNAETGYSAGVWDCTPFVDADAPYGVDEFMLLLEGEVTMRLPDAEDVTVRAGEAFVIPKGLPCQWSQPGYVRKVFMIVDDAVPEGPENPSLRRITKPALDGAPLDGAVETTRTVFENATGRMSVSVRNHAGGTAAARPAPGHMVLHVLEGALTLSADGAETRLAAGETGYVRAGTALATVTAPGTRVLEACYAP